MRELIAFVSSWFSVTTVFWVSMFFEANLFQYLNDNKTILAALTWWGIFGIYSGAYFIIVGIPTFYMLCKYTKIKRFYFVYAGVAASLPILLFSVLTGEVKLIVSSFIGGIIGGLTFALLLPFNKYS